MIPSLSHCILGGASVRSRPLAPQNIMVVSPSRTVRSIGFMIKDGGTPLYDAGREDIIEIQSPVFFSEENQQMKKKDPNFVMI